MRLPTRKSELLKQTKQSDGPVYLTKIGIEKLKQEMERIRKELPAAREELQRTREMGDLSENAAYQEAKYQVRRMNNRLITLEERLKMVIEIQKDGSDRAQLGSRVVVEKDGEQKTFEIVGPHEANPMKGRLSHVSPLGSVLLNRTVGETVEFTAGDKKIQYTIKKIS